ncbi:MAG: DUF4147 domain-containing protein [Chitinophagaceae bacterium]|nr:DUF4147 domain-containing protein [Chitinophagaceae bacterium]
MALQHLKDIFLAGVSAVKPAVFIPLNLTYNNGSIIAGTKEFNIARGKVYIVSVGKAAAAMAAETEKILGSHIAKGIVVTKYQHALPLKICKTIEAGHPVPDEKSIAGGKAVVQLLTGTKAEDTIIMLISGGASALLSDLPPGCALSDLQHISALLLDCGAAINEINCIRKHLSLIKGGQLMRHTSATVIALILSDVPGDDLSVIASGLTVPDNSSFTDAWKVIEKYGLQEKITSPVKAWLTKGLHGEIPDTPDENDPVFNKVYNRLVATNNIALGAAKLKAEKLGYVAEIISPPLTGEAEEQATAFMEKMVVQPTDKPYCLLWGGETTVTIRGKGKGGRNQQFALAALNTMHDNKNSNEKKISILCGGTDGTDGPTDATGAIADRSILEKAKSLHLDPRSFLRNNDAYHFFKQTGGLVITGPTQTNVMDMVVGLAIPQNNITNK